MVDECLLIGDPRFLGLSDLVLEFLNVLLDSVSLVLKRPLGLLAVAILLAEIRERPVELVNLELLCSDQSVSLFNLSLFLDHILPLRFQFDHQLFQLPFQQFVLTECIQVVNLDPGNFIADVFNLYFLFRDGFVGKLGLLQEACG